MTLTDDDNDVLPGCCARLLGAPPMVFWSWMEERDCAGCAFFRRTTSARVVLPASFSFCSWSLDRLRAVMLWICAG